MLCEGVHGGGCPVEQVGEKAVDRVAPEECPPENAGAHEQIDKGKDGKVAEEGDEGEFSKIVRHQWGGEEGADESNGHDGDEPCIMDEPIGTGTQKDESFPEDSDAEDGDEGELEADVVKIEGIDAQHDEKGECTGVGGDGFAMGGLAEQQDGEHGGGSDEGGGEACDEGIAPKGGDDEEVADPPMADGQHVLEEEDLDEHDDDAHMKA